MIQFRYRGDEYKIVPLNRGRQVWTAIITRNGGFEQELYPLNGSKTAEAAVKFAEDYVRGKVG